MSQTASVDPDLPYGGHAVTPGSWPVGPGGTPAASGACPGTDPCVLTGQNDQHRNSNNGNAANLGKLAGSGDYSNFGLAYIYPVTNPGLGNNNEPVIAQPLYVTNVTVGTTSHNMLLVATLSDYVYAFDTTTPPAPGAAGIWQGGKGPAVYTSGASSTIFVGTGNGGFQTGGTNWGNSLVGFSQSSTGTPTDSFTPSAYATMNYWDQDMGTPGPLVIDGGHLTVFDKTGQGYVLNPASLGGYNSGDTGALGEFSASLTAGETSPCDGTGSTCDIVYSQVYWNGNLFVWPWHEDADWCVWNTGSTSFVCSPSATKTTDVFPVGFPGGTLALSSNGTSTPVLWAIFTARTATAAYTDPGTQIANWAGFLIAYQLSAGGLEPLWWSKNDSWAASIFAIPTVVNGRVYVPTYDHGMVVYANF
jgi:hypothetical protein